LDNDAIGSPAPLRTSFPVNSLTVAMVFTTGISLLMAAVRLAALFP
jgi:hypothetical protein